MAKPKHIHDLTHPIRCALPYRVVFRLDEGIEICGREYELLGCWKGPHDRPQKQLLSMWSHPREPHVEDDGRTIQLWLYDDDGRDLDDYLKAVASLGRFINGQLHRRQLSRERSQVER